MADQLVPKLLPYVMQESLTTVPADLAGGVSKGLRLMGAPAMWAAGFDGTGAVVGVIDTGIDASHPDLQGKVLSRRDYVGDGLTQEQFHPHGTHVAGIIAAHGQLRGVAPGALLRDYRVLDANGSGRDATVAQAVRDAVADGCRILNMSLGSSQDDPALHQAIVQAVGQGCLVVVAMGNSGGDAGHPTFDYPGAYPEVVGVGAIYVGADGSIQHAPFSDVNPQVDVCAPGVNVLSTKAGGGYLRMSGTSMAAPHAAGFAALLLQKAQARLGHLPDEATAWAQMKVATVDVDALGIDASTGAGFLCLLPSLPQL